MVMVRTTIEESVATEAAGLQRGERGETLRGRTADRHPNPARLRKGARRGRHHGQARCRTAQAGG
eukprot:4371154-Lingulodinium_polyedra.AAC.1